MPVPAPKPADKPVPTFVAKGGTVTVTDKSPDGLPPLSLDLTVYPGYTGGLFAG